MKAKRLLGGRFRLLENIARGGQGTVWLAEDTVLRREVALKQLVEPAGCGLSRHREYALREAHALARVNHHNVVTIHDVFEVDEEPWLVMRYVLGKPLSKILLAGPLDERQVAAVTLPVLQGLNAAHRQGVVHRDVKPHNILVGDDNEIVLVDFGTAYVAGFPSLTDPRFLVCTPEFTAPERFDQHGDRSQAISPATDLWSLGVTMFCAIEGFSPFRRSGEHAGLGTMNAVLSGKLPPMVRAGTLAGLITRLLRMDPADRPNALEIERVLTAILHGARHVEVPLSRPRPSAEPPSASGPSSSQAAGPPDRPGPSAGPAAAPAIISELSDGSATAWLLSLPREQAATALHTLGRNRDRIFRQIAEVRPDAAAEILAVWTEAEAGLALRPAAAATGGTRARGHHAAVAERGCRGGNARHPAGRAGWSSSLRRSSGCRSRWLSPSSRGWPTIGRSRSCNRWIRPRCAGWRSPTRRSSESCYGGRVRPFRGR